MFYIPVLSQVTARASYAIAAVTTMALGLLLHEGGAAIDETLRDVLGDALWAAMLSWWIGVLAPGARLATRSAVAFAICAAVETSQLFHPSWLDAIRATRPGQLVLGSGFVDRDFAAYALGVAGAALIENTIRRRRARN